MVSISSPVKPSPRTGRRPFRLHISARSAALAIVLAVAATLRLYGLEYAQYRYDDDTMFALAREVLASGGVPWHGMHSSFGVHNGPTALYVLLPAVAVVGTELGATVWIALLNVLTVALTYPFARAFWGTRIALLATALFATNPWAVVYGRRIWLNSVLPLFALLFFWAAMSLARYMERLNSNPGAGGTGEREFSLLRGALYGAAASALLQVHLSALAHLFTYAVGLVAMQLWRRPRILLFAVGGLAVTFGPYLSTTLVPDLVKIVGARLQSEEQADYPVRLVLLDLDRIRQFLYLLGSRGYQTYAGQGGQIVDTTQGLFAAVDLLLEAAFVVGLGIVLWRAARARGWRRVVHLLLAASVVSPVLLPSPLLGGEFVYLPHHLPVVFPMALVIAAIGLDGVGRWLGTLLPALRVAPYIVVAGTAALQITAAGVFFRVHHEYWPLGDYGFPLRHTLATADLAIEAAGDRPILIGGIDGGTLYRVLRRRDLDVRLFEDRNLVPSVESATEVVYLTTSDSAWSTQFLQSTFPFRQQAAYVVPGIGWNFRLFRVRTDELNATLDSWLPRGSVGQVSDLAVIEGAKVGETVRPGEGFEVFIRWRFLREPDGPYMTRVFLVDPSGRSLFFHEEVAYPAGYMERESDFPLPFWRRGDAPVLTFFNRFLVPVPVETPPGTYSVTLRMVSILDWRSIGRAVPLGQVRVLEPSL